MADVEIVTDESSTALATIDRSGAMPVMTMDEATRRFKALEAFATSVMTPGIDYGAIPGTDKPTLLKPGAEKLCTFFGLSVSHGLVDKVEDWAGGFFYYRYQCSIYRDGVCIAVSEGSCNSKEKKYRWRTVFDNQATPEDKRTGRLEERTGKNNKPYKVYVIENKEPFDLVNTLQKMAQKRAHIAACLIAVGASQFFTQDMEDMAQRVHDDTPADVVADRLVGAKPEAPRTADTARTGADVRDSFERDPYGNGAPPPADQPRSGERVVSDKQVKRLHAIAYKNGWETREVAFLIQTLGFNDAADLTRAPYEKLCDELLLSADVRNDIVGAMTEAAA